MNLSSEHGIFFQDAISWTSWCLIWRWGTHQVEQWSSAEGEAKRALQSQVTCKKPHFSCQSGCCTCGETWSTTSSQPHQKQMWLQIRLLSSFSIPWTSAARMDDASKEHCKVVKARAWQVRQALKCIPVFRGSLHSCASLLYIYIHIYTYSL